MIMDYLMSSKAQYQLLIILISNLLEQNEVLFSSLTIILL